MRSPTASSILILSDRAVGRERAAIPALLAVAGVHHHLVREGTRLQTGLVLESGEPREVHHFATLMATAPRINPYLMSSRSEARRRGPDPRRRRLRDRAVERRQGSPRACSRRSPRWASRRSSPTTARRSSRRSALAPELVDKHFTGTASRISGGIGMDVLAMERSSAMPAASTSRATICCRSAASMRGAATASATCGTRPIALLGTRSRWRKPIAEDEAHPPRTPRAARRCAACSRSASSRGPVAVRGRRRARDEIVKRFVTGAMSLGSLSREAHETLGRDEPPRRQVEHRRRREDPVRYARSERRPAPLGDQAGGLRAASG